MSKERLKEVIKNKDGMIMFLIMVIILAVSLSVIFSAYLVKNRLFSGRDMQDGLKALQAAETGLERAGYYYKSNTSFFDSCSVGDCIDFSDASSCTPCENPDSKPLLVTGINYQVKINSISATYVGLTATGFVGNLEKKAHGNICILACTNGNTCMAGACSCGGGEACTGSAECVAGTCNSSTPCPGNETVTYGSKTYNTILVGTQCWLKENLDVGTKLASASDSPTDPVFDGSDTSAIQKWCYDNDDSNCTTDGGLYTWAEALALPNSCNSSNTGICATSGNVRGICPVGWHIPSYDENTTLMSYLGANSGSKLAGGSLWESGSVIRSTGYGSSGFNAVPSGYRYPGGYSSRLFNFGYWTSTQYSGTNAFDLLVNSSEASASMDNDGKNLFCSSVRCIKD